MLARYAAVGAFESAAASAKSLALRFAEGGLDITTNWMRRKRRFRNRLPDWTQESAPANTESSRSFRNERVHRWRPGRVAEGCAAGRAFRSRGTGRRGLRLTRRRGGAWRCARRERANLRGWARWQARARRVPRPDPFSSRRAECAVPYVRRRWIAP